jgi:outer membrane lipoprotein LolB
LIALRRRAFARLGAIAFLLLSACSALPPQTTAERNYAGRFSLAVTRDAGSEEEQHRAWSGRFSLAVAPNALTLDLVSPLGSTIARIETDAQEARLLVPDNGKVRVERGTDAQALSQKVLGWSLPIEGMPDWVEGHPATARPYRTLPDVEGQNRFEQDGWTVTVERPGDAHAGLRLQMDHPADDASPQMALRVVLDAPAS